MASLPRRRLSMALFALLLAAAPGAFGDEAPPAAAEEASAVVKPAEVTAEASAPKAKEAAPAAPAKAAKPAAKAAVATAEPAGDEDVRPMRSGRNLDVVAKDLRLGKAARERLARIAERYARATGKKLVVTGGTRTPARQAKLMIDKLRHGEDIVALYENKAAAKAIRDAYVDGHAKKLSDKALVRAVRKVIEAQIARGVFISQHLQAGAADVRSRDMGPAQEAAFRAAVKAEPGVLLVDERETAAPHFHLGL